MQRVVLFEDIGIIAENMEPDVFRYIGESKVESCESFEHFDLLAFDWYDIHSAATESSRILIYLDENDLFFICRDQRGERFCRELVERLRQDAELTNEQLLVGFFVELFRGDMHYLESYELECNQAMEQLLAGRLENAVQTLVAKRQELLRLKRYYEQIDTIFDEIAPAENKLLSKKAQKRLSILGARTDRYLNKVANLQEIVGQMQDTYQAQLAIQQNDLMKVFTLIAAIFLPLTLLVGWYGMNFTNMPELHSPYGYPLVIVLSVVIVVVLLWYFKHKKWL